MARDITTRSRQSGFTLLEIVISVMLLGILSVVGSTMISGAFYTTRIISTEHLAYSAARYALERMAREIREMHYDPANGTLSLSTMSRSQLSFVKSGVSGTSNVNFQYTSPTLYMSYPPADSAILARDISDFSFTYLDANRVQITDPQLANSVRFVRIALTTSPTSAQTLSLDTQVSLRNP